MTPYYFGSRNASIVLVQAVDGHSLSSVENEINEIRRLSSADFCLIAVKVDSWNSDLSP